MPPWPAFVAFIARGKSVALSSQASMLLSTLRYASASGSCLSRQTMTLRYLVVKSDTISAQSGTFRPMLGYHNRQPDHEKRRKES